MLEEGSSEEIDFFQGLGTRILVSSEETNFSLSYFSSSSSFGLESKLSSKMKASSQLEVANILQICFGVCLMKASGAIPRLSVSVMAASIQAGTKLFHFFLPMRL